MIIYILIVNDYKQSKENKEVVMKKAKVHIIGAGLAGSEAAWQLAKEGLMWLFTK